MSAYDRIGGSELKQETYFVEGKGWRTHHVISSTSSFEREATAEEIEAVKPAEPTKKAKAIK